MKESVDEGRFREGGYDALIALLTEMGGWCPESEYMVVLQGHTLTYSGTGNHLHVTPTNGDGAMIQVDGRDGALYLSPYSVARWRETHPDEAWRRFHAPAVIIELTDECFVTAQFQQ